jgi:hypothetical protein
MTAKRMATAPSSRGARIIIKSTEPRKRELKGHSPNASNVETLTFSDQVAGNDKENVDPNKPAFKVSYLQVKQDNAEDTNCAQPCNLGPKAANHKILACRFTDPNEHKTRIQ